MKYFLHLLIVLLLGLACEVSDKKITLDELENEVIESDRDNDGDGYLLSEDCDDNNSAINSGQIEICDGVDNDCDGEIDEGVSSTFYLDADDDGFGDSNESIEACDPPEGYVGVGNDCDDGNDAIYPGAIEYCDGIDSNCDGVLDEDMNTQWFIDNDGDGFGDETVDDCSPALGLVTQGGDCNDNDADINPGEIEICDEVDNDCDGQIDEGVTVTFYLDSDNDEYGSANETIEACEAPFGYVSNNTDCDDSNTEVNPAAAETCDSIDNDCDGLIDEESGSGSLWYADADGDGYGDGASASTQCDQPPGYVDNSDDCDDADASINPDMSEACDGADNDCNGVIDDGFPLSIYFYDSDGDGYGDPSAYVESCSQPTGTVVNNADCDDSDASVNPMAQEICNSIDDDCDGTIDVGAADALLYYSDTDGDGYGAGSSMLSCVAPSGYVDNNFDCHDANADIYPGADEICNGLDDNCDAMVDNGAIDAQPYYNDSDGDGFGGGTPIVQCFPPMGYSSDDSDCNDMDPSVNPNAAETCNGIDDNCNGVIDDGFSLTTFYVDSDGDGYGDAAAPVDACQQPIGTVLDFSDCDDSQSSIYPGAPEQCNGIDDNCDGLVDDGWPTTLWYADDDGDGYGDSNAFVSNCLQPLDHVSNASDCNDADALIYPGAPEQCNSIDDNCNGVVDDGVVFTLYYTDADGDGYGDPSTGVNDCLAPSNTVANDSDCNDADAAINPLAIELCNGIDDNCNGSIDDGLLLSTFYIDSDNDGYGDSSNAVSACAQPSGTVVDNADCNDSDSSIYPSAPEMCNGIDDDCNTVIDDNPVNGTPYFEDTDGDGFGGQTMLVSCALPQGFVTNNADCDDAESAVNPNAPEACNGIDDDCNGLIDEGFVPVTYYTDADSDGYGDFATAVVSCIQPANSVTVGGDCDDTDVLVNPGAVEVCNQSDDNCDGQADEGLSFVSYFADSDNDGYGDPNTAEWACAPPIGTVLDNSDCNDANANVNPAASEICNGLDDDCDGGIDVGAIDATPFYLDGDGDGFGSGSATYACNAPAGQVAVDGDCNDSDAAVNPGGVEQCNNIDDDCDGLIDDGFATSTWYADADGDGYGNASIAIDNCLQPASTVANSDDCDDANASIYPFSPEQCNGVDDDCNGQIDDGVVVSDYYDDNDGDGFGDPSSGISDCLQPAGMVLDNTDCNDSALTIYPGADEYCNGVDDDCDSVIDNDPVNGAAYYQDTDGDGYGGQSLTLACSVPAGHVTSNNDCNDSDSAVNPAAAEVCNGIDDDCNGQVDEGFSPVTYYTDADNDGYGDSSTATTTCSQPSNSTTVGGDCNDANAAINPSATEICNQIDDDCDGPVDEGLLLLSYFADSDGDGYGDPNALSLSCSQPANTVADNSDCDDLDPDVNPFAIEVCNGYDDDCDGTIDIGASDAQMYYADNDGDGFGTGSGVLDCVPPANHVLTDTDCNDADVLVNPDAIEMCNGIDDDCDGVVDGPNSADALMWYPDYDGDGYGELPGVLACYAPANHVEYNGDCDDGDSGISPNSPEDCDGIDNDCNGVIDDGASCPCTAAAYGGSSYLFCTQPSTWWNARSACESYGNYQLTIITSWDENNWITQTANSVQNGMWWWIGLSDTGSENYWEWVDGSGLSYSNWSSNQPDNYQGNEDCVHIYANNSSNWNSGDWNDMNCDLTNWYGDYINYICESSP